MSDIYQILIADDHQLFRDGLASMINSQSDMKIVGRAEDGLEVFTLARELNPDLIIMDVQMPKMNGFEATMSIRKEGQCTETPILGMTANADEHSI